MVYPHNQSLNELVAEKGSKASDSDKSEKDQIEWTADLEVTLFYSMVGHKPVGPNRFFQMYFVHQNFCSLICKDVDVSVIWKKLETMYDLATLDESESITTKGQLFSLPLPLFGEMMENAKLSLSGTDMVQGKKRSREPSKDTDTEGLDKTNIKKEEIDKSNITVHKDTLKPEFNVKSETTPKQVLGKFENKETKKGNVKDKDKKDTNTKRESNDIVKGDNKDNPSKRDIKELIKEEDKEIIKKNKKNQKEKKTPKKDSLDKKITEQFKKDLESKKSESSKKTDSKPEVSKLTRVDTLKKESLVEKRKETPDKKTEIKTVEKKFENKSIDKKSDLNKSIDKKTDYNKSLDKKGEKNLDKKSDAKSDKKNDLDKSVDKKTESTKKADKKFERSSNKTLDTGSNSSVKSPDAGSKPPGKTPDNSRKVKDGEKSEKESFSLKRLRDSWSSDDTPLKRPKGRPTRNSGEPVLKTTPAPHTPGKRRRIL